MRKQKHARPEKMGKRTRKRKGGEGKVEQGAHRGGRRGNFNAGRAPLASLALPSRFHLAAQPPRVSSLV